MIKCVSKVKINVDEIEIPIKLADNKFNIPFAIDVIIGAEWFCRLLGKERPKLESVLGIIPIQRNKNTRCNLVAVTNVQDQLEHFWEIEIVDPVSEINTNAVAYDECEQFLLETVTKANTGKFVVWLSREDLKPEENSGGIYRLNTNTVTYGTATRLTATSTVHKKILYDLY